ncbi:UNVERIFIED_CONTAM: hypothetical protein FKN15_032153 [Acipenser sinensis]
MRCPPKHVPSADRFFSLCRPTVQPLKSYSVGGQRRSGQLTGRPAGTWADYRGRWCASRGHPGRPKPSPLAPWELPSTVGSGIAWTRTGDLQAIERILHSMRSTFTRCAAREPLSTSLFNSFYAFSTGNKMVNSSGKVNMNGLNENDCISNEEERRHSTNPLLDCGKALGLHYRLAILN